MTEVGDCRVPGKVTSMTNKHCVKIGVGDSVLFHSNGCADEFRFSVGIVKALTVTVGAEDEDLLAKCMLIVYTFAAIQDPEDYFTCFSGHSCLQHAVLQTDKTVSVSINVQLLSLRRFCSLWEKAWGYMAGYFVIDSHLVLLDCSEMHVTCIIT
eukprot:3941230-Rhodomonas_salina.1